MKNDRSAASIALLAIVMASAGIDAVMSRPEDAPIPVAEAIAAPVRDPARTEPVVSIVSAETTLSVAAPVQVAAVAAPATLPDERATAPEPITVAPPPEEPARRPVTSRKAAKTPKPIALEPRWQFYAGPTVATGPYVAVGDLTKMFRTDKDEPNADELDPALLDAERSWYETTAALKAEARTCSTDRKGRERCKERAVKLPPEPVIEAMKARGQNEHSWAFSIAAYRHLAGPKPEGWEEMVVKVREAWGRSQKEGAFLASALVNEAMLGHYAEHAGRILTPVEGFRKVGLCRDYAAWKGILLLEAGAPGRQIRFATVLPSDGGAGKDVFHVVAVVKADGVRYVLNMGTGPSSTGPMATRAADRDSPVTSRGVIWWGSPGRAVSMGPVGKKDVAALAEPNQEAGE